MRVSPSIDREDESIVARSWMMTTPWVPWERWKQPPAQPFARLRPWAPLVLWVWAVGNGDFEVLEGSLGSSWLRGLSPVPPSSFPGAGTEAGWCLHRPSLHWGAFLYWAEGAFFLPPPHCCWSKWWGGGGQSPPCSTRAGSTNTFILLARAAAITSSLTK